MATNRKRVDLSVKEKLRIIEIYDSDYKHLYNVEKSLHKLYSLNSRQTKISEYFK